MLAQGSALEFAFWGCRTDEEVVAHGLLALPPRDDQSTDETPPPVFVDVGCSGGAMGIAPAEDERGSTGDWSAFAMEGF